MGIIRKKLGFSDRTRTVPHPPTIVALRSAPVARLDLREKWTGLAASTARLQIRPTVGEPADGISVLTIDFLHCLISIRRSNRWVAAYTAIDTVQLDGPNLGQRDFCHACDRFKKG
jgi:hypothetical protein